MNHEEYTTLVKDLSYGKRMPTATYIFLDGSLRKLHPELATFVDTLIGNHWGMIEQPNVVKFNTKKFMITFSLYTSFENPHPVLRYSLTIDLTTGIAKDRRYCNNPPIIHRREHFVPKTYDVEEWKQLTADEESYDLYEDTAIIGRRDKWNILVWAKVPSHLQDRYKA